MKKFVMAIFLMLFLGSCGEKKEEVILEKEEAILEKEKAILEKEKAILGEWKEKHENGVTMEFFSDNTMKDSVNKSGFKWVILDDGRLKVTRTADGEVNVFELGFSEDNDTLMKGWGKSSLDGSWNTKYKRVK